MNPSLYIHIPFCSSKCRYCGFYSETGSSSDVQQRVVDQILQDIEALPSRRRSFPSIFIGGGTPTLLPPRQLDRLLTGIESLLEESPGEWTIESNPETLSGEKRSIIEASGVDRISLGVQSFSDRVLERVGRNSRLKDVLSAVDWVSGTSLRWSIDLIAGLPGEDESTLHAEKSFIKEMKPPHISCYALGVEEGTPLAAEPHILDRDREEARETCWWKIRSFLLEMGYEDYETSNFGLNGEVCQHNLAYWSLHPYWGLGPSAVSTLPDAGGNALRLTQASSVEAYLQGVLPEQERLSERDFLKDVLLMGLRTRRGISLSRLKEMFGETIAPLLADARLECTEGYLRVVDRNRDFLDSILLDLFEIVDHLLLNGYRWPS